MHDVFKLFLCDEYIGVFLRKPLQSQQGIDEGDVVSPLVFNPVLQPVQSRTKAYSKEVGKLANVIKILTKKEDSDF